MSRLGRCFERDRTGRTRLRSHGAGPCPPSHLHQHQAGVLSLVSSLCFVLYLGVSRYEERRILAAKIQTAESTSQLFVISVSAAVDFDSDDAVKDAIMALTKSNAIRYAGVWRVQNDKIQRLM